jgi:Ca2+/Na+ antiporter
MRGSFMSFLRGRMNNMSLERIGIIVLVSLTAYLAYFTLKAAFLYKININKWIIFAVASIILFIRVFIVGSLPSIYSYILSGIFVMLLLWIFDLKGSDNKKDKNNDVFIKPKKSNKTVDKKKRK